MKKNFLRAAGFILIGAISGILGSCIIFPWLAGLDWFSRFEWMRHFREGVTVINTTEKITITENEAMEEAIAKEINMAVGVISQRIEKTVGKQKIPLEKPEIISQGSGFILTSDGLVATAGSIVPETAQQVFVLIGDRQIKAEIKKRDKNSGLVLLKINENNLPVVSFADENLKLGQRIFLIAVKVSVSLSGKLNNPAKFVDLGIVKELLGNSARADFASKDIVGSPLFNIKGELVGMNSSDSNNQAKVILLAAVRELLK